MAKKKLCQVQGCAAPLYKRDTCARHYRMEQAPECSLDCCEAAGYTSVVLGPEELERRSAAERALVTSDGKFVVCEAHYRRRQRGSRVPWDSPITFPQAREVVSTRIPAEAKRTLERAAASIGQGVYDYTARLLEDEARRQGWAA